MTYKFFNNIDPLEYDSFVKCHKYSNLLQSSSWRKVKSNWGHMLAGLKDENDKLVAASLVLFRPLKFGWSVWYIPHGPILDYSDHEIVTTFFSALKKEANKSRCAFVKIDPPVFAHADLYVDYEDKVDQEAMEVKELLESLAFEHGGFTEKIHDTIQPRYQAITFASEQAIEQRLSKRAKKEVRDAKRRMVEINRVGKEGLDDFYFLISKTEEAKDINLRNKEYFANIMDIYGDDCYVYIASINLPDAIGKYEKMKANILKEIEVIGDSSPKKMHRLEEQLNSYNKHLDLFKGMQKEDGDKALIADGLTILYGHSSDILYAGFNRDYRNIPGQDPVFLKSMQEAFSAGAKYFNMGGVENDLQDGLMAYKKNFDPHVVAYLGEFDLPVNNFLYKMYLLARKIFKS